MIPAERLLAFLLVIVCLILPVLLYVFGRWVFHTLKPLAGVVDDIWWGTFGPVIGVLVGGAALISIAQHAAKSGRSLVPPRLYTFLTIFLGAVFLAMGVGLAFQGPPYDVRQFGSIYAFLGATAVALMAFSEGSMARVVSRLVELRQGTVAPESVAIVHLLDAAIFMAGDQWRTDRDRRWRVLYDLDIASKTLRRDFPATFRSGDPIADAAAAQHYAAVAEGIRGLKKLVLVPRADSSEVLPAKAQAAAWTLIEGAWDTLPRHDPPAIAPRGILAAVVRAMRAVFVAVLPVAFLAITRRYGYELPGDIKQFAEIGAWVWAFVGLMMAIDPDFAAKITTTRSFSSLLSGKREG
ncbi:MAG TPA: hypothetical protein VKB93_08330 [Thermoanaerobaculia bacterium]|nr:hypothetical protein [Thermoanaerobaculia bacterium]